MPNTDCSGHNCVLHCPGFTEIRRPSYPFKTPHIFEMPFPRYLPWQAHLAALHCCAQLFSGPCRQHAPDMLQLGVVGRYWISWACGEKRLCRQHYGPAIDMWTSTSRLQGGMQEKRYNRDHQHCHMKVKEPYQACGRPGRQTIDPVQSCSLDALTKSCVPYLVETSPPPCTPPWIPGSQALGMNSENVEEEDGRMQSGSSYATRKDLFETPLPSQQSQAQESAMQRKELQDTFPGQSAITSAGTTAIHRLAAYGPGRLRTPAAAVLCVFATIMSEKTAKITTTRGKRCQCSGPLPYTQSFMQLRNFLLITLPPEGHTDHAWCSAAVAALKGLLYTPMEHLSQERRRKKMTWDDMFSEILQASAATDHEQRAWRVNIANSLEKEREDRSKTQESPQE
ncbi:hypothetical protein UY3_12994 [Chelonia mydas]|uniref:Uncharacterized protein n=1 Tax=Chelonia mydas TaxID=8469 RepID=M7AYT8_CHEMY|nr:hypothetical protein UY3_12994 [Chelonia mydas]